MVWKGEAQPHIDYRTNHEIKQGPDRRDRNWELFNLWIKNHQCQNPYIALRQEGIQGPRQPQEIVITISGSCLLELNECVLRASFKLGERRKTSQGKQLHWPDLKVKEQPCAGKGRWNFEQFVPDFKFSIWSRTINLQQEFLVEKANTALAPKLLYCWMVFIGFPNEVTG